jgi:hypothetical protein
MMQLTAAMKERRTMLQICSNSRTETDLFKSLSKTLQLWLQQIKTQNNSNSNLPQSRNSSNEQNRDKSRNQTHWHETRTTSARQQRARSARQAPASAVSSAGRS